VLVDEAMLGDEIIHINYSEVKPDVICIGYDQNSFNKNLDGK